MAGYILSRKALRDVAEIVGYHHREAARQSPIGWKTGSSLSSKPWLKEQYWGIDEPISQIEIFSSTSSGPTWWYSAAPRP